MPHVFHSLYIIYYNSHLPFKAHGVTSCDWDEFFWPILSKYSFDSGLKLLFNKNLEEKRGLETDKQVDKYKMADNTLM